MTFYANQHIHIDMNATLDATELGACDWSGIYGTHDREPSDELDFAMFDLSPASPAAAARIDRRRTAARYRKVMR